MNLFIKIELMTALVMINSSHYDI